MAISDKSSLATRLALALPKDCRFTIHHLSSPPTPCAAIYSPPPGEKPEKTSCENHFLSVAIDHNDHKIQVFAIEIQIYTAAHLTTIFVAKADSTGYIHLLNLPKGTPSPSKAVSSEFLSFLVERRHRRNRKLVVSLFARAQDQYLFPGSIENPGKHVLDDRRLIKWWCQVLDPLLHHQDSYSETDATSSQKIRKRDLTSKAYLRVPGCDLHETKSFFPSQSQKSPNSKWTVADPLLSLVPYSPNLPERCLIPRFPDDPKSRFVDELDEELTEPSQPQSRTQASPFKGKRPGKWRSVGSLEEFWELMAFRQECASGRLVGFLWGVFTPVTSHSAKNGEGVGNGGESGSGSSSPSPSSSKQEPAISSGEISLPPQHYARTHRLLLHLDYATLDIAAESSKRWIDDVALCAGREGGWGFDVVGTKEITLSTQGQDRDDGKSKQEGGVNVLQTGLVRRKKKREEEVEENGKGEGKEVNVLQGGLVRKKVKTTE